MHAHHEVTRMMYRLDLRLPVLAVAFFMLVGPPAAFGQLLAAVDPAWSPFVRNPPPEEMTGLLTEARALLYSNPERVAEVLAEPAVNRVSADPMVRGLRADALYLSGGDRMFEAQKAYRTIVTSEPSPEGDAWARFMLGNIHKGLGFWKEAEMEYRAALRGPIGPWTPALLFNLSSLEMETGRFPKARERLLGWLRHYPAEPGRVLVLYLLGECEAALGDGRGAAARFKEARRADPRGWIVRPETGYAMAELLEREGNVPEAVRILEALAEAFPGSRQAALARLEAGRMWSGAGAVSRAAKSYAVLLDRGAPRDEAREALLRICLLGAEFSDTVELTDPLPAYRAFYRPAPALQKFVEGRDPEAAQRALRGLALMDLRAGDVLAALDRLVQVFSEYPESPESGRAYETFMDTLETHLTERLAAQAYAEVVGLCESRRDAVGWVPSRDVGAMVVACAEAYEALGALDAARQIYQELIRTGTRALATDEIGRRILWIEAESGDPEAVRRWAELRGNDWGAQRSLARTLAEAGNVTEARKAYSEAVRLAPGPEQVLKLLGEENRLTVSDVGADTMLDALERRLVASEGLPQGPERDAWMAHARLVQARLRFALGEFAEAARAYRTIPDLTPADTYLRALAESRSGESGRAAELFGALSEGRDPLYAGLADLHLDLTGVRDAARGKP